jgi:hypothetical protein
LAANTAYKFILEDSANNILGEWDNISGVNNTGGQTQNITAGNYIQLTNAQVLNFAIPPTPAEVNANTSIINAFYAPGNPRRYGAVGNGINDDTAAVQTAFNVNQAMTFNAGDTYAVKSVVIPTGVSYIDFNGAVINGISTTAQNAAVILETNFCDIYNYHVSLAGINGQPTPNPNYNCATWWSVANNGSQFTSIYGCTHTLCGAGIVYGAMPNSTTSTIQSENAIYGMKNNGVGNPLFINNVEGFLHLSEPILFNSNNGWTNPLPSNSVCVECVAGQLLAQGGEMVSDTTVSIPVGAILSNCTMVGMYWEFAPPVSIVGDGVQITGGNFLNSQADTSAFVVQPGVTGSLQISDFIFRRETGVGANSTQPMISVSASSPTFNVVLCDTRSEEWAWGLTNAFGPVRLIEGGTAVYKNHRLHITANDPNVYNLNTPIDSILPGTTGFDSYGYFSTLPGWFLATSANGTTLTQGTAAGPPGFNPSQVHLHATGQAMATSNTAIEVRPGELYWMSAWAQIASGTTGQVGVNIGTTTSGIAFVPIADQTAIGLGVWTFVEGPIVVPAQGSLMEIGGQMTAPGDLLLTDVRVRRAS